MSTQQMQSKVGAGNNNISFGQNLIQRCGAVGRMAMRFQTAEGDKAFPTIIKSFVNDLESWGDAYWSEAMPIEHSHLLSEAGKIEKLNPVKAKYNTSLNNGLVKQCRTLIDMHMEKVRKAFELPPEVVGGDPVMIFLQSQEIRSYLRSLPMAERIRHALNSDDPALLHALDTAAPCLQLLPPDLLQKAKSVRVQRLRGKELLYLEDERQALERISGMLRNVPAVCDFVKIQPALYALPESVFAESDPEELKSFRLGTEEMERLTKEMIDMYIQTT